MDNEDKEEFGQPKQRETAKDRAEKRAEARKAARAEAKEKARENAEERKATQETSPLGPKLPPPAPLEKVVDPVFEALKTAGPPAAINRPLSAEAPFVPANKAVPEATNVNTPVKHHPVLPYLLIRARVEGVMSDVTVHGVVVPPASSSSSSSSLSSSSFSSVSSPYGSSSSKNAIVPFGDEFIGWVCAEEPEARFFDTYVIGLNLIGRGKMILPQEFIQSVEPGSLMVISALSMDRPACVGARLHGDRLVVWALSPFLFALPKAVVVRVQGKRLGSEGKFTRYSEQAAIHNNSFWAQAWKTEES